MMIEICRFPDDAPCAYSMTYDEGFVHVLANALPIHERHGFPGHVDMVAGQLGKPRECLRSSMNGIFHMGAEHLRFLLSCGWSVGSHSYSHYCYPDQPGLDLYREVVLSRHALEDTLGVPVTFFAVPNDAYNYEPALPFIRQAGYRGCHYIDGGLSRDDVELLKIPNFMVASGAIRPRPGWPETLLTENLAPGTLDGGWLCETTHLVMHDTIQDWKNTTPEALDARFSRITEITDGKVWAAVPEDVIDYILLRRATTVRDSGGGRWEIAAAPPVGLRSYALTFRFLGQAESVGIDGERRKIEKLRSGARGFTVKVRPLQQEIVRVAVTV